MMDQNLLKEVYEKSKKKMATDGQVDTNEGDNFRKGKMATIPQKKPMPFQLQGGKGGPQQDKAREASTDAARRRLTAMKNKKPGVGNFGGPGDGVHTKKTGS